MFYASKNLCVLCLLGAAFCWIVLGNLLAAAFFSSAAALMLLVELYKDEKETSLHEIRHDIYKIQDDLAELRKGKSE